MTDERARELLADPSWMRMVLSVASRKGHRLSDEEASDCLHDCLLKAHRWWCPDGPGPRRSLESFFWQAVRWYMDDRWRSRQRRLSRAEIPLEEWDGGERPAPPAEPPPEAKNVFDVLSDDEKDMLEGLHLARLTVSELAARHGVSPSVVTRTLKAARAKLKESLGG